MASARWLQDHRDGRDRKAGEQLGDPGIGKQPGGVAGLTSALLGLLHRDLAGRAAG